MAKKTDNRAIEILRDGPICMYYKNAILDEDCTWFNDHRFEVFDLDCRSWTRKNFHKKLKEGLRFPEYYGENLDAFEDCLEDMFNQDYRGLVLVFRNFDQLVEQDRSSSEALLDIIACASREWLVEGHKLICLIQSNDPNLHFPELGGISPGWNGEEWFNKDRRSS